MPGFPFMTSVLHPNAPQHVFIQNKVLESRIFSIKARVLSNVGKVQHFQQVVEKGNLCCLDLVSIEMWYPRDPQCH